MAWKYKQEYVRDGDVVEPSDYRININEFTSEVNGFLDADNVEREAISSSLCKRETFTAVFSNDTHSRESFVFRHDQSGWQKEAFATFNKDISGSSYYSDPAATEAYLESTRSAPKTRLPAITFTPDQDGLLICEASGFVDWMNYQLGSDGKPKKIPLTEYQYGWFAKNSKKFKMVNSLVLSSMWRLTVNGQSVAETGVIGNDYRSHPIYLCGATPIIKNQETVVQLEAQFVWYSPGKDAVVQASSFEPKSAVGVYNYRHDCSLNCPMLLATYRKR